MFTMRRFIEFARVEVNKPVKRRTICTKGRLKWVKPTVAIFLGTWGHSSLQTSLHSSLSDISAHLTWNIFEFFPGYILASLSGDGAAFISGNIFAGLARNLLTCFPGNIFTNLQGDFLAAFLRNISTSLMSNLRHIHLRTIFTFNPWDISTFFHVLGVALPAHDVHTLILGQVVALHVGCVPALHHVVDHLAHLHGQTDGHMLVDHVQGGLALSSSLLSPASNSVLGTRSMFLSSWSQTRPVLGSLAGGGDTRCGTPSRCQAGTCPCIAG